MSYFSFDRVGGFLSPVQISDLEVVFRNVCEECGEDRHGKMADQCAGVLIRSVQRGIEDKDILRDIGLAVFRSHQAV